ncbi:MAG: hypothetical protein GXO05_01400 [Aquificae bacterium]|nr:hypothetical protein [Aquificota bacterium]
MKLKDYKHDLNAFVFKMEASAKLLSEPENLSLEEIKLISDIILQNTSTLRLFFECFSTVEKLQEKENRAEIISQPKFRHLVKEVILALDRNASVTEEENRIIFRGNFKTTDQIGKFFLQCLNYIFPEGKINDKEIVLIW